MWIPEDVQQVCFSLDDMKIGQFPHKFRTFPMENQKISEKPAVSVFACDA